MVLLNHPLTFRDVIVFMAQAQQYVLDIMAFLNYILYVIPHVNYPSSAPPPVRSDWMGCFTADNKVCNKPFYVGVLVWLVRDNFTITPQTIIKKLVKYTFPDDIIRSMYSEGGKPACPFDCLYCGPSGLLRHVHTHRHYIAMIESSALVSQPSSYTQASSHVSSVPTQVQTRRAAQKECAHPKQSR